MRFNPLAISVMVSGAISVVIAIHAWMHRSTHWARTFALFMVATAVYILGYSLELASLDVNRMLLWSKVEYIGILAFPTIYLFFSAQYSGHEKWLTRKNVLLLFSIPVILMIIKLYDGQLHIIYSSAKIDNSGIIPLLSFTRGPLYLVVTAYNLLIVTLGNYLLIRKWRSASSLYRWQTSVILSAAVILYLMYGFYLSGITPIPSLKDLDVNPFIYSLWGLAIGVAIFKYRLFALAPIARDTLIEMLSDGVVVVDEQARIVDANPEAQRLFGWDRPPLGQFAAKVMNNWVSQAFLESVEESSTTEAESLKNGATVYYQLMISSLKNKQKNKIGYLIIIHDITALKKAEKEMEKLSWGDDLTGLYNRRGFKILANQTINMAHRMNLNATLIFIDLDELKWINDFRGHAAGDQALIDTAQILKEVFRSSDIIARVGGDEFVAMAIDSAENPSGKMLERLQEQLDIHNTWFGKDYVLSFSCGAAHYEWENPNSLEMLLEQADQAMYANKRQKNHVRSSITNSTPALVTLDPSPPYR